MFTETHPRNRFDRTKRPGRNIGRVTKVSVDRRAKRALGVEVLTNWMADL